MKRTLGFWLTILAPLLIVGLEFLVMWAQGESMLEFADGTPWLWNTKYIQTLWALFLLPLFVTLETALQAGLEHNNHVWKQILVQPVPRWTTIAAKQFSGLIMIGISQIFLWIFSIIAGVLLRYVRPDLGFNVPIPWWETFTFSLSTYLIAWMIIAIHSWVSIRWSSFVVAMASGILATMSGVFLVSSDYAQYYPWAMAGLAANNYLETYPPSTPIIIGALGGVIIFLLSNLQLRRRDIY
jgi:hypothetical protein